MPDFFVEDNLSIIQENAFTKQQTSNQTGSSESGKVESIFSAINAKLSTELVNKTGAIYQFNVKGNFSDSQTCKSKFCAMSATYSFSSLLAEI